MDISIIIPTYNEEEHIGPLVRHLWDNSQGLVRDIVVVDGGSQDCTLSMAGQAGARAVISPRKGRAAQMNLGASLVQGSVLYFVHADSLPPASYVTDLLEAIQAGYPMGCFRFRFNSGRLLLRINSYCTRFDRIMCRGGDQSIFMLRSVFDELQGYQDDYVIMEEYELLLRARNKYPFRIIPKDVLVSARKYDHNGYFRVNLANLTVFLMFFAGFSQKAMLNTYKHMIHHPKF
jgi:rSAM/selenodomain-associated transferase 2